MKEIKFRVWDKKEKGFLIDPEVEFIHHEKSWGNEFYLEIRVDWSLEDYDPTRFIFLQFTGLKDKNGKEIYEGDICQSKYGGFYIVNMPEGVASFDFELKSDNSENGNRNIVSKGFISSYDIVVIGNIYENPELLEGREEIGVSKTKQSSPKDITE